MSGVRLRRRDGGPAPTTARHGPLVALVVAGLVVLASSIGSSLDGPARSDAPLVAAGAVAPRSVLWVDGEVGEQTSGPRTRLYRDADFDIEAVLFAPNSLVFSVRPPFGTESTLNPWFIRVERPPDRPIAVGSSTGAGLSGQRGWSDDLDVSGDFGCHDQVGRYTIHDFAAVDLTVTRLAMSFEYHCHASFAALHGEVRFASGLELNAVMVDPVSATSQVVALGETAPAMAFALDNVGDVSQEIALRVTGLDADSFEIVDEDCTQGTLSSGESCTIEVAFTPVRDGPALALLEIRDSTARGVRTLDLTGTTTR